MSRSAVDSVQILHCYLTASHIPDKTGEEGDGRMEPLGGQVQKGPLQARRVSRCGIMVGFVYKKAWSLVTQFVYLF